MICYKPFWTLSLQQAMTTELNQGLLINNMNQWSANLIQYRNILQKQLAIGSYESGLGI